MNIVMDVPEEFVQLPDGEKRETRLRHQFNGLMRMLRNCTRLGGLTH
jgi:hypothetical protein